MSILSPADRAVLWRTAVTSGSEERESLLRVLAAQILESVGRRLDMYAPYQDEVVESVMLLDSAGYLGRDDLREAFEEADEDDEAAQRFAALTADYLRLAADIERLGIDTRLQCLRLASTWREHLLGRSREDRGWLTVADVAALHEVTPQAVYKWIRAGRIRADRTPGGSYRVPADQFESAQRLDRGRLSELQAHLARRASEAPPVSDEEITEEILRRRRT